LIIVAWFNNNFRLIASRLNLRENPAPVKLTYLINFLGILPVGEAVFAFDKTESFQGKDVYHLNARAENLKVYHFLRKATAVLESYVDQQRLEPVFFRQRFMLSGAQETVKEAAYDQENQVMQIGDVRRQILPGTQDPLSAIFNIT